MRLVRFGEKGRERPGLLREDSVVDLRKHFADIPDIGEAFFRQGWLERLKEFDAPADAEPRRLGSPVHNPTKIICLGKNYIEHAKEGGFTPPEAPLIFSKGPNTLSGPTDPICLPRSSGQVDWEVELALVIGKEGKRISAQAAWGFIAGYSVFNDVSGREAQFADSQWFRGKSFDTFAPMGPALVTPDEIEDVGNLDLTALVDGEVMQTGNTRDMIFDIPTIIENISEDITLVPGDIISTGTPAGVGIFRDPPVLLQKGSVVECRIESIGRLINRCE